MMWRAGNSSRAKFIWWRLNRKWIGEGLDQGEAEGSDSTLCPHLTICPNKEKKQKNKNKKKHLINRPCRVLKSVCLERKDTSVSAVSNWLILHRSPYALSVPQLESVWEQSLVKSQITTKNYDKKTKLGFRFWSTVLQRKESIQANREAEQQTHRLSDISREDREIHRES